MGSGASKHRRELRRVQAAHVLTNTLRHNNRVQQRHRERAELDALRDEVAILRKRCGDCTHGDVEKDVAERETVIRELEAMLRGPQGKGAARPVAVLTIEKLRGEIEVACKTFKARTADEHKLFLAGGITSRVEAEVRIQQLLAASNLTSQRVAPRVLASCVGAGRPFILSEAGSGGWLSRDLAASYCPPHSLDQVNRSVPHGLAPYCKDLGRLLTRMDEHGLLQIDWQVGHMMRVDQHLMAVDFGRAGLYNASLPQGANWCQLAAVMSKLMSRTGVPLISTEMQHFQMPQGVVDIVTLKDEDRCLVRCLRDFGTQLESMPVLSDQMPKGLVAGLAETT